MGVILALVVIAAFVGLPILGVMYLASAARNAIHGSGRGVESRADRARLYRDRAHMDLQAQISYAEQSARAEAEAARQAAIQRAQAVQQTPQKWV